LVDAVYGGAGVPKRLDSVLFLVVDSHFVGFTRAGHPVRRLICPLFTDSEFSNCTLVFSVLAYGAEVCRCML